MQCTTSFNGSTYKTLLNSSRDFSGTAFLSIRKGSLHSTIGHDLAIGRPIASTPHSWRPHYVSCGRYLGRQWPMVLCGDDFSASTPSSSSQMNWDSRTQLFGGRSSPHVGSSSTSAPLGIKRSRLLSHMDPAISSRRPPPEWRHPEASLSTWLDNSAYVGLVSLSPLLCVYMSWYPAIPLYVSVSLLLYFRWPPHRTP